jgi:hypothetical protein
MTVERLRETGVSTTMERAERTTSMRSATEATMATVKERAKAKEEGAPIGRESPC